MNDNTAVMAAYGLQKAYGACRALDGVNMQVRRGDVYGLVGRNGAGKTTLMRMVTGQSEPSGGEMELFGASGKNMRPQRCRTGAMIEIPSFSPFLTAHENLEYYRLQRGIPGKQAVDEVLELVDLADAGKKKFKAFSLGMKQRLGLALALMNHPDFLILDEPINGLDPEGVAEFRQILRTLNRERQTTILISSHILSELANVATRYGFSRARFWRRSLRRPSTTNAASACGWRWTTRPGPPPSSRPSWGRISSRCCPAMQSSFMTAWTTPSGRPTPWRKTGWPCWLWSRRARIWKRTSST